MTALLAPGGPRAPLVCSLSSLQWPWWDTCSPSDGIRAPRRTDQSPEHVRVNGVSSPPARCVLSIAIVAVLSHPVWAVAQDDVTYVARDFTFTGPDAIAAGMVPVRL